MASFHKICYTTRTTGYKYRTLSTNTGEKKRRDSVEDSVLDKKFREIRRVIFSKVDKEIRANQKARDSIRCKAEKIESKIEAMVELQNNIAGLRRDLREAEGIISSMSDKVCKIELMNASSDFYSFKSSKVRPIHRIILEQQDSGSNVTHI